MKYINFLFIFVLLVINNCEKNTDVLSSIEKEYIIPEVENVEYINNIPYNLDNLQINVTFNTSMKQDMSIELKRQGISAVDINVEYGSESNDFIRNLIITFSNRLEYNEPYTLTIDEAFSENGISMKSYSTKFITTEMPYTYSLNWGSKDRNMFGLTWGMTMTDASTFYVTDADKSRILKLQIPEMTLISEFGRYGTGNGEYNLPYCITHDDNYFYITDSFNHRIQKLDYNANWIATFGEYGSGNGQMNVAYGIVVDDSFVYTGDYNNGRVMKWNKTGNFEGWWGESTDDSLFWHDNSTNSTPVNGSGTNSFNAIRGLSLDDSNNLYVADSGNHRISVVDLASNSVSKYYQNSVAGTSSSNAGEFNRPYGVAISSTHIYVADTYNHRIQKLTLDGTFVSWFGFDGTTTGSHTSDLPGDTTNNRITGAFYYPYNIIIDEKSDDLIIADTKNNRFQFIDSNTGLNIRKWEGYQSTALSKPKNAVIMSDNRMFVADTFFHRIQEYDLFGNSIKRYGKGNGSGVPGDEIREFNYPADICKDDEENLYILDRFNFRIQLCDKNMSNCKDFLTGISSPAEGIAVDGNRFYLSDTFANQILVYDLDNSSPTKTPVYTINSSSGFDITLPRGIDAADNTLFVADYEANQIHKLVLNTNSNVWNVTQSWGNSDGSKGTGNNEFNSPLRVKIHDEYVFVADQLNNRVIWFDFNGNYIYKLGKNEGDGSVGGLPGEFNGPSGVEFDSDGNLYVIEEGNNRIQKFLRNEYEENI